MKRYLDIFMKGCNLQRDIYIKARRGGASLPEIPLMVTMQLLEDKNTLINVYNLLKDKYKENEKSDSMKGLKEVIDKL